ncbi:uncharacterized protein METZ01_LOCUS12717 [marine metagenome]|uniref:Uncharacterized protein n=1 Tax=marine metagenome TaxID=408172 RepID=A0A381P2G9_9ZZZZ
MVHRMISVFIFLACAHASDNKKLAVFHFQNQGLETDAAQSIPENIQGELQKTSTYEFLDGQKIETIITEQKINREDCADTCLARVGKLAGADQVLTGTAILQDGLYTISARLLDVESGTTVHEISFDSQDKNELLQFGLYYLAAGLAGKPLPKKNGGTKMYTVTLEAIAIDETDFFRSAFGEPYPVYIILTENSSPIWETHVGHLRGYRTLKESFVLALNAESTYELQIYDPGFQQEAMHYRITSAAGTWPFQEDRHALGERSFIELSQKLEPGIAYKPNKKI